METLGWQIGAILFGVSALVIAIYVAKLLNSATRITDKVFKIIDYNERYIQDTIENVASITEDAEDIISLVNKVTSITKVLGLIKRK